MHTGKIKDFIEQCWDQHILPTLVEYIKIPNKSPLFDSKWQQHGYMQQAVDLLHAWCQRHGPKGMQIKVLQEGNKTPLIFIEVASTNGQKKDNSILLYGHLDKQPEMEGWDEGLGPWDPVVIQDKLYGRGGADDGYAVFAALTAIKALQQQETPHNRCVIIIEASEESGSVDLPYYIEKLKQDIGSVDLIICLDSGCGNYENMWVTTSLRGIVGGKLKVTVASEGVHSGIASGIVPSSFRILRQLLSRIEDEITGEILLAGLHTTPPAERLQQAEVTANVIGSKIYEEFPLKNNTQPVSKHLSQLLVNRTWKPAMEVIGIAGIPEISKAGSVLRPYTEAKISMRLPPTVDAVQASRYLKAALEDNPPYDAQVEFVVQDMATGWDAPPTLPWLLKAADAASQAYFHSPVQYLGEGGTIPFMGMLGSMFPKAQFLVTGVLGPKSNAHGPNEFLHIPYSKQLTGAVAHVIYEHAIK